MASLPPSTDFTAAGTTEAGFKTAITGLRDYLSGLFGTDGTAATARTALGALGTGGGTFTGDVSVSGTGLAKLATSGDITAYRSGGTTGVVYLNSASTRYVYFDGSNYQMPGAALFVNGAQVYTTATLDLSSRVSVDAGVNGIGTFCTMQNAGSALASGATTTNVRHGYFDSAGNFNAAVSSPGGTWRNVTGVSIPTSGIGMFQRVA